jgi:hypothetical protein
MELLVRLCRFAKGKYDCGLRASNIIGPFSDEPETVLPASNGSDSTHITATIRENMPLFNRFRASKAPVASVDGCRLIPRQWACARVLWVNDTRSFPLLRLGECDRQWLGHWENNHPPDHSQGDTVAPSFTGTYTNCGLTVLLSRDSLTARVHTGFKFIISAGVSCASHGASDTTVQCACFKFGP